jgi:alpha-mannosidase
MAADAGLTSSSWARGPYHQWGPMAGDGDPRRMQFRSEFEWIAPSGVGLLTHYMPAHYAAGWWMDSSTSLAEAEDATYNLFSELKSVALTRNVLLPVGTDYTPPNAWVTDIHHDWNSQYTWPRFVCAIPSDFFTAVRAELAERGTSASPQTRDMNPIYTGKDVSYIDTKQANRAAEDAVLGAERFAVFASLLAGARYPEAALAKAWVQSSRVLASCSVGMAACKVAIKASMSARSAALSNWPSAAKALRVASSMRSASTRASTRARAFMSAWAVVKLSCSMVAIWSSLKP